jgi:hypothetical protein
VFAWEVSLAAYLVLKGFRPAAGTTVVPRPALRTA